MIDVVIPYVHSFSMHEELRFALRSIEANLQCDYRIVIIGDIPTWVHRVRTINLSRCSIGNGSNLNDAISKMDWIVNDANISDQFLRWYDDIYLLRPMDLNWINRHFSIGHYSTLDLHPEAGVYKKQSYDTWQELKKCKLPEYCCEVHMPRLFEKEKLKKILYSHIIFCGKRNLLLQQSLYFNTYFPEKDVVILRKDDDIKAGFYGHKSPLSFDSTDLTEIQTICKDKHILNHDDKGWSRAMECFLYTKFPKKSRYEK